MSECSWLLSSERQYSAVITMSCMYVATFRACVISGPLLFLYTVGFSKVPWLDSDLTRDNLAEVILTKAFFTQGLKELSRLSALCDENGRPFPVENIAIG